MGTKRLLPLVVLAAGLLLRLAVLSQTTTLQPQVVDEQQYIKISRNLVAGNGFGWAIGEPTSIRPPLYPGLVAALWTMTGSESLQLVRVFQILLALATSALVYVLGARLYNARVGLWAALISWLYPSLIFFNFLILTETLFTFLLIAFVLSAVVLVQQPRPWPALLCGVTLGLAALTRSILWPVPLLLCPLLLVVLRPSFRRRAALSALVLAGFVATVGPWAVRNTRLQGVVTIVDTMGGMNLRMGNYEYTPDDRMWDAVALTGEKSWVHGLPVAAGQTVTEGQKEKWAQRMAIEYMFSHPGQTLRRSVIKFCDFWGLEREFVSGVQKRMFTPPGWFQVSAMAAILGAYIAVVVSGAAGVWLARPADWRAHVLMLLPIVLITALHTVVFGHSRYHLPLVPLLAVYGAALASARAQSFRPTPVALRCGAAASITVLVAVWIRQVVVVDFARIGALLSHAG